MNADERGRLIDDLIDGEISEADFLLLEAELSVDQGARYDYYARLALTESLVSQATSASAPARATDDKPRSRRTATGIVFGALAAAAAAVVVTMFSDSVYRGGESGSEEAANVVTASEEQSASGFAVLTGQAETRWGDGRTLSDGALLPEGLLRLQSGVAQIELFSGVMAVVEAPAEFEILSSMEMSVVNGRVRAHVPEPAQGFRIRTVDGDVVDLGTEFALDVSGGHSEVHVLDGEVEWHSSADSEVRKLTQGEAVRTASNTGERAELVADAEGFLGVDEMRERLVSSRSNRYEKWRKFSEALRADDRLIAYYRPGTGDRWNRRVPNLATHGAAGEGAVVAAVSSADRWGRVTGALDFSSTGSRVRVSVPGTYRSISLLSWVKINSLDRWYNSLFLTDGHEQHEPHWQIMDDGRLFFSVKKHDDWDPSKGERDKHVFYSPSFWNASLSGKWLMVATVYDVDAQHVTHYLNGEQLSRERIPQAYLVDSVRVGNASLANWGRPEKGDPHFAVRNLNGSMDAFMFFKAALSLEEIRSFYNHGKP